MTDAARSVNLATRRYRHGRARSTLARMKLRLFGCLTLSLLSTVVACGGDDGDTTPIDAPIVFDGMPIDTPVVSTDAASPDAAPSVVMEVPCAGATIAATITAPGFAFTPMQSTVALNAVVQFTMPGSHSAVSGETPGVDDGQFRVNFNETKCLRFTAAGTYGFWCNPHQFTGSITVTP